MRSVNECGAITEITKRSAKRSRCRNLTLVKKGRLITRLTPVFLVVILRFPQFEDVFDIFGSLTRLRKTQENEEFGMLARDRFPCSTDMVLNNKTAD